MENSRNIESLPNIKLGKYQIWGTNRQELLGLKKEIFHEEMYETELDSPEPVIIDAGAHVGMAALFFKLHYPQSRIICVEPNPALVPILEHNIWFNRLDNVQVVPAALSDQVGERTFFTDTSEHKWFSAGGFMEGAWNQTQVSQSRLVPIIPLDNLINGPVDLLKMDIEGAEEQVLRASRQLGQIKHLIIELHPRGKKLPQLENILEKFNFSHTTVKGHYGLHRLYAKQ